MDWTKDDPEMVNPPGTDLIVEQVRALLDGRARSPAATQAARDLDRMLDARSRVGIAKYGRALHDHPVAFPAMLQHAVEELLDAANYLMTLHAWADAGKPDAACTYRPKAAACLGMAVSLWALRESFLDDDGGPHDAL